MANCAAAFACGSGITLSTIESIGPNQPVAAVEAAVPRAEPISWSILGMVSLFIVLVICVAVVMIVEKWGNND